MRDDDTERWPRAVTGGYAKRDMNKNLHIHIHLDGDLDLDRLKAIVSEAVQTGWRGVQT